MDRHVRNLDHPLMFAIRELRMAEIPANDCVDTLLDVAKRSLYAYNMPEDGTINETLTKTFRKIVADNLKDWKEVEEAARVSGNPNYANSHGNCRGSANRFMVPIAERLLKDYRDISDADVRKAYGAVRRIFGAHSAWKPYEVGSEEWNAIMEELKAEPAIFINETIFELQVNLFKHTLAGETDLDLNTTTVFFLTSWLVGMPDLNHLQGVKAYVRKAWDTITLDDLLKWLSEFATADEKVRLRLRTSMEGSDDEETEEAKVDDTIWDTESVGSLADLYAGDEGFFHQEGGIGTTDDPRTGQRTYTGSHDGGILTRHVEGSDTLVDDKVYAVPDRALILICMEKAARMKDVAPRTAQMAFVDLMTEIGSGEHYSNQWMKFRMCLAVLRGYRQIRAVPEFRNATPEDARKWWGWVFYQAIMDEFPSITQKYKIWYKDFYVLNLDLLETLVRSTVHCSAEIWRNARKHLGNTEAQQLLDPNSWHGMLQYVVENTLIAILPHYDTNHRAQYVMDIVTAYGGKEPTEDQITKAILQLVTGIMPDPVQMKTYQETLYGARNNDVEELDKVIADFRQLENLYEEYLYDEEEENDEEDEDDLDDDDDDFEDEDDDLDDEDEEEDDGIVKEEEAMRRRRRRGLYREAIDTSPVETGYDDDGGDVFHIFHIASESEAVRNAVRAILPKEVRRRYHSYDPDQARVTPEMFLEQCKVPLVMMTVNFSAQLTSNAMLELQDWAGLMASYNSNHRSISAAALRKDGENPILVANRILQNEAPNYQWSHDAVRMIVDGAMRYAYAISFLTPKKFNLRANLYRRDHTPEECQKLALSMVEQYIQECRDRNTTIDAENPCFPIFGFDTVLAAAGKNPIIYFEDAGFPDPLIPHDAPTDFIL